MIVAIIIAFLIGWFVGIAAYKYGLKNSPVILPPKNRYDALRDIQERKMAEMDIIYKGRLQEYNRQKEELEKKRKEFYEKNPDFPIKTMYMQVCAPPQKFEIKIID